MSAYRRMIGRELPATLAEVLDLPGFATSDPEHQHLLERKRLGAWTPDEACRLALSHLDRQELGLARDAFLAAKRRKGATVRARVGLAVVSDALGQHDHAAAYLDSVLAEEPAASPDAQRDDAQRYALLCAAGFAFERHGDWRQAKSRYIRALSSQPDDHFALHRLIAIHLAHGEHAEAVVYLREVLNQNPQEMPARICLAHLLHASGHHAAAVWEYEQALCLQPDGWEMPLDAQFDNLTDDADAIDYLEKLVGAQPHFPDLRLRLGNLYSRTGDDHAASAAFEQALELHPEYLEGHIALARHDLRMGRTTAAIDHFRRALAINEQNVEAYAGLAVAARGMGSRRHADDMLVGAARIANNTAVLTAQLGVLAAALEDETPGRHDEPLDAASIAAVAARCEEALEENPAAMDLRLRFGMLCRLLARRDEALAAFRQVLMHEPNCSEAWLQLATLWVDLDRKPDADVAIRNALAPDRRGEEAHYHLALIYSGEAEFDLTAEQMEESDPDSPNRILAAIEQMHLTGLTRGRDARRTVEWSGDARG